MTDKMEFAMFKNSQIPKWINIFQMVIILFMTVQVYWFYFNHQTLVDAGISIQGVPDLNIIYTTGGRLVAMIAITIFVLITQNPNQYLIVLLLSILREGQETFIDPMFPYANAGSPLIDFGMHVTIVLIQVWAFITVYRIAREENKEIFATRHMKKENTTHHILFDGHPQLKK